MALVQIVCGEVRRVLKSAPDNCVQMCVTSPPYWGLRAYGTNPQIWGGDPDCDHFWGEWEEQHQIREASCHGKSRTTDRFYGAPSRRFQGNHEKHTAGSYCQSCGAWLGELGAEPTPEQYVQNLVEVFREVRRILREDGILFLNLGDSYARSAAKGQHKAGDSGKQAYIYDRGNGRASATADLTASGMKEKDLVGIPWQTALALRADGWYLRSEIIWEKPNCLPESVRDRPTRSHEQIFLLTKSPRYYYDMEAIREAFQTDPKENYPKRARVTGRGDQTSSNASTSGAQQDKSGGYPPSGNGRNARTVWRFTTQPFNAKKLGFQDVDHFATFPEELAERCILAGSSEGGCCSQCRSPFGRIVEVGDADREWQQHCGGDVDGEYHGQAVKDYQSAGAQNASDVKARILAGMRERKTVGWRPSCDCYDDRYRSDYPKARRPRKRWQRHQTGDWWRRVRKRPALPAWPVDPCLVLDPFGGSGTTGLVAGRLGRRAILCDLNESYCKIARKRCGDYIE